MPQFCEFLHRIRVIFYLCFRPLDVPMYAFGTKNEDFRSGSTYPLSALEGSSSFFELELPSFFAVIGENAVLLRRSVVLLIG